MSGFNWNDHPIADPGGAAFSWNDHPVEGASTLPAEAGMSTGDFNPGNLLSTITGLFGGSTAAAGQKTIDAATAGHLPQVAGAASAVTGGDYVKSRDAEAKKLEEFAKNNPKSSLIGTGVGTALTIPVGDVAAAKTLSGGGKVLSKIAPAAADALEGSKIAKGIVMGGEIGALQNPGDKEGVVDPIQFGSRTANAGIGAGIGLGAELLPSAISATKSGAKKLASTLTGVPEDAISTYANKQKEVDALIKQYGDNIADASDAIKEKWNRAVETKKAALSQQKGQILAAAEDKRVSVAPILDELEKIRLSVNQKLRPEVHAQIKNLQNKIVQSIGGLEGSPAQIEEIKSFLQEEAKPSYLKGGQIFPGGDKVELAAKRAAAIARKQVNAAVPEVASVNNKFQLLFDSQSKMNRNMLKQGASEASIISAGNGTNSRNAKSLARLGALVDQDMVGEAKLLAAQKQFANAPWLPADFTGKAVARLGAGAAAGGLVGGIPGAAIGSALTSPAALKQLIRLKALAAPAVEAISSAAPRLSARSAQALESAAIQGGAESSGRKPFNRAKRLKAIGE